MPLGISGTAWCGLAIPVSATTWVLFLWSWLLSTSSSATESASLHCMWTGSGYAHTAPISGGQQRRRAQSPGHGYYTSRVSGNVGDLRSWSSRTSVNQGWEERKETTQVSAPASEVLRLTMSARATATRSSFWNCCVFYSSLGNRNKGLQSRCISDTLLSTLHINNTCWKHRFRVLSLSFHMRLHSLLYCKGPHSENK